MRLVQMNGGNCHESEMFTRGNNYFVVNGVIHDDANRPHSVSGTELFLYTTGCSFYVYTKDEVKDILFAHDMECDGLVTDEQSLHSCSLIKVINSMGGW